MAVAIDPNQTHRYVICTDRTKPIEEQRALVFYFPTAREQRQIARLFDESGEKGNAEKSMELHCQAVKLILAGWENFRDRQGELVPFDPSNLDAILSDNDLIELNARLLKELSASEMDKKKFALSLLFSSASSAASATGAGAPSLPAKSSPSSLNALCAEVRAVADARAAEEAESSD